MAGEDELDELLSKSKCGKVLAHYLKKDGLFFWYLKIIGGIIIVSNMVGWFFDFLKLVEHGIEVEISFASVFWFTIGFFMFFSGFFGKNKKNK